jgi:hypothetical protein
MGIIQHGRETRWSHKLKLSLPANHRPPLAPVKIAARFQLSPFVPHSSSSSPSFQWQQSSLRNALRLLTTRSMPGRTRSTHRWGRCVDNAHAGVSTLLHPVWSRANGPHPKSSWPLFDRTVNSFHINVPHLEKMPRGVARDCCRRRMTSATACPNPSTLASSASTKSFAIRYQRLAGAENPLRHE